MKTLKETCTCRCSGFCQPGKRGRKQEVKNLKYVGNFLFSKILSLFVLLSWGKEEKKVSLLCKLEKRIPRFCTSLSQSVEKGPQHCSVSCWWSLTNSPRSSGKRRKNTQRSWAFWSHHAWRFQHQKSPLKALHSGAIIGDRGLLSGAVQTHSETSPVTKDLLSKQRLPGKTGWGAGIRNELTSSGLHGLEVTPEADAWYSDFQPGNLLFLTGNHFLPVLMLTGC